MAVSVNEISIVHWMPREKGASSCGYCKNENCSVSDGLWGETMTPEDYQNLIERGWRRSGKYLYKPIMNITCCPQYAIRCDVNDIKLSKSQKKVSKKFKKYLLDGVLDKISKIPIEDHGSVGPTIVYRGKPTTYTDQDMLNPEGPLNQLDVVNREDHEIPEFARESSSQEECPQWQAPENFQESVAGDSKDGTIMCESKKRPFKEGVGVDPNRPPSQKAKVLRMEKRRRKLMVKGVTDTLNSSDNSDMKNVSDVKSLSEFLAPPNDATLALNIVTVKAGDLGRGKGSDLELEYDVYKKYQIAIHNDPASKCSLDGFVSFLVKSPLKDVKSIDSDDVTYGTYHQQYWISDKLIAVGVVDILPRCVSSVYFFYDPDYKNLTLGVYGALREIEFTQAVRRKCPELKFYCMGFYVPTCPKMLYKARFGYSELLCPETYKWVPLEKINHKFATSPYNRLDEDPDACDDDAGSSTDMEGMKILMNGLDYTFFRYYRYKSEYHQVYHKIISLVGKKCAKSLFFVEYRN